MDGICYVVTHSYAVIFAVLLTIAWLWIEHKQYITVALGRKHGF
jgi:hypothetical protein